jgi:hypothetical protein
MSASRHGAKDGRHYKGTDVSKQENEQGALTIVLVVVLLPVAAGSGHSFFRVNFLG